MDDCFSKAARKELRKALASEGCEDADPPAQLIEDLVQAYYYRFVVLGDLPSVISLGEAVRVLILAGALHAELMGISRATRRRLIRKLEARCEEMSLVGYEEAINDMCMFALYAMQRGEKEVANGERKADRELRSLVARIGRVWHKATGNDLPKPPPWIDPPSRTWRYFRRLEQHPLWIVGEALGFRLDGYDVAVLLEAIEKPEKQPCAGRRPGKNLAQSGI